MRSELSLALAAALSAVVVAVVAIADHRDTSHRVARADVASWFCEHRNSRCDEPRAESIHDRWEIREFTYKVTEAFTLASFAFAGLQMLRRRRSS